MKTILTLLLSFGVFAAAFAQTDAEKEEAKRVILGERKVSGPVARRDDDRTIILGGDDRTVYGKRSNRYPQTYGSSRERQIVEINRAYNEKIYSIRNNRTLSRSEKERIIRQLELDRRRSIDQLRNDRYDNRFDDNQSRYKKSKKYKNNNGNHYGWQKGKGNPHDRN